MIATCVRRRRAALSPDAVPRNARSMRREWRKQQKPAEFVTLRSNQHPDGVTPPAINGWVLVPVVLGAGHFATSVLLESLRRGSRRCLGVRSQSLTGTRYQNQTLITKCERQHEMKKNSIVVPRALSRSALRARRFRTSSAFACRRSASSSNAGARVMPAPS